MAVDMAALVADLAAESAELTAMLAPLAPADWDRPTPADGWAIRDQVSHLAYFDQTATMAATDPDRFRAEAATLKARGAVFADAVAADHRHLAPGDLFDWLGRAREEYLRTFAALDPATRRP